MVFLIKIPFRLLWTVVAALPFISFLFCVFWSVLKNFEETTSTHCNVQNFLPSISTAVGYLYPQKYVWQVGISLHCVPRFLASFMYYKHFQSVLKESKWYRVVFFIYFFQNIEIFSLISLSFVSSAENFSVHQKFFIAFVVSALLSMSLLYVLLKHALYHSLSKGERKSVRLKLLLLSTNFCAFTLCVYFYFRHNWYCEPGMYTLFALFEYTVVLSNIGFHFTAVYDFSNQFIIIANC